MHAKTMEGLAGASMNMKILNTPFRVYKEAERRGDTAVMERAMGYVSDFAAKAKDYQKEAEKGMEEDREEAREKAKEAQEDAIRKRREEREEMEKRIEESRSEDTDTDNIRKSEKAVLDEKSDSKQNGTYDGKSVEEKTDAIKMASVMYTKTGEAARPESGMKISISV